MKSLILKSVVRVLSLVSVVVFLSSFTFAKNGGENPSKVNNSETTITLSVEEQILLKQLEEEMPEHTVSEIQLEEESFMHIVYDADGNIVFENEETVEMPQEAEYMMTIEGVKYYLAQ